MSDQSTAGANVGEQVGIPRPTQFTTVIHDAIESYPGGGGPGIQLAAWVANVIIQYFNLPPGEIPAIPLHPPHHGGEGDNVGAVRLTNLSAAVQKGLDEFEKSHQHIGPTQADFVARAVITWLQDTY